MWDFIAIISGTWIVLLSLLWIFIFTWSPKKASSSSMVIFDLLLLANCLILEMAFLRGSIRFFLIFSTILSFSSSLLFLEVFLKEGNDLFKLFGELHLKLLRIKASLKEDFQNISQSFSSSKEEDYSLSSFQIKLPTLEECFLASEKDFDLLLTLIVMAKENNPHLEVKQIYQTIHYFSKILRRRKVCLEKQKGSLHPEEMIQLTNHYLYSHLKFEVDHSPSKHNNLANLCIDQILIHRKGYCLSLCALYLVILEPFHLPLFGVSAPGHFFLRYDSEHFQRNIESTAKGIPYENSYYQERYNIHENHLEQGLYLSNLRKREVVIEFLNNRGNYYYRQGQFEEAEKDFDRAVNLSANFVAAHNSKGFLALRQGKLEEARVHLNEALELDPSSKRALLYMGELYMKLNNLSKAKKYFEKALIVDPESSRGLTNLGMIFGREGNLEKSLKYHQKALQFAPDFLYAHNNLGATYYRMKEYDKSLVEFQKALEINSEFFPAIHNMIRTLKKSGRTDLAKKKQGYLIEHYHSLLDKNPQNDKILFELAKLYQESQESGKSLKWIQKALNQCPYHPDYLEFLADYHFQNGDQLIGCAILKTLLKSPQDQYLYDKMRLEERIRKYEGFPS